MARVVWAALSVTSLLKAWLPVTACALIAVGHRPAEARRTPLVRLCRFGCAPRVRRPWKIGKRAGPQSAAF